MIEPDIDIYGSLARGSALADYLEVLALAGKACTRAQLEDAVRDRNWSRKRSHMIVDPNDLDANGELDEDMELTSHVEEAWSCLEERCDVLGDRYPFALGEHRVSLRSGIDVEHDPYVAILCLTVAHAYGVDVGISVTDLFEEVVASALESRDLLVSRVGENARRARGSVTFPETLRQVGEDLAIRTVLGGAAFSRHANDMGADLVAHFTWRDLRTGRMTFVCQVTCANSDAWRKKLGEAAPGLWAGWFAEPIDPACGLAVPHHVPPRTHGLLVTEQRKFVFDRLRLVLCQRDVSAAEVMVIRAVRDTGVDDVAAA